MSLTTRLVLYPVFAFLCLALFSFLLFPFESLKSRIEAEMEKGLGGGYEISIGRISPAFGTGVVLKKVSVNQKQKGQQVLVDRARMTIGILPLLWGTKALDLEIEIGKGDLEGTVSLGSDGSEWDLDLDELDLSVSRLFLPANFPLGGSLSGEISLEFFSSDPLRNSGTVRLDLDDLHLSEGATAGGMPIPPLVLAKKSSKIDIEVVRGNWEVKSIAFKGGDLSLEATGKVFAARRTENYRLNLKGTFQPATGSEEKLPFLSLIEDQKADGKFPFSITGQLTQPAFRIGTFKLPI